MTVTTKNMDTKSKVVKPQGNSINYIFDIALCRKPTSFSAWWIWLVSITFLSICTRLYKITVPNMVIWDEAHFGKMSSWYLNGSFFFDVHPPGGKMLLASFGYLAGYNGSFSFSLPGNSYEDYPEIIYMRMGCALLGSGIVPLSFLCVWYLTKGSLMASILAASFSLFEMGTVSLSKLILLDPPLMLFIMVSFHGLCLLTYFRDKPFSIEWMGSMVYQGIALGCVLSTKFIGVFTILVVGLYTVCDLWLIFSDNKKSLMEFCTHFVWRVASLILLPIVVYVVLFFIHDVTLYKVNSGENNGISNFSPSFQMNYEGSSLYNLSQPSEVSYGNVITLRNDHLGGGYLHSHVTKYPKMYYPSEPQQVTDYKGKDINNYFRILFPYDDPDQRDEFYSGDVEHIKDGQWLRLFHLGTNATVVVSKNKSAVATKFFLAFATPHNLTDPALATEEIQVSQQQLWFIKTKKNSEDVRAMRTSFQLVNGWLNCVLARSQQNLPFQWGFRQGEIGCTKNFQDPASFWKIEINQNPYVSNSTFEDLKANFFSRFVESHQMMTYVNSKLKPEFIDDLDHKPWMWPIMYMSQPWFDDTKFRFVLLGNPFIFGVNLIALITGPLVMLINGYQSNRHKLVAISSVESDELIFSMRWLLIGYLFHYIPFFFMHRILYYHHYFPAMQFSNMFTAVLVTYFVNKATKKNSTLLQVIVVSLLVVLFMCLIISFCLFHAIGTGYEVGGAFQLHNSTYRHLRLLDTWMI